MSKRRIIVGAMVIFVLALTPGMSGTLAAQQPSTLPFPVALSATGGTSKGSYQAGVDWLLTEFSRRTRVHDPDLWPWLQDDLRRQGIEVVASVGASAGNIDAMLSAISWCTKQRKGSDSERIAAEDSLFWKVWLETGIGRLLGRSAAGVERPNGEYGIFTRDFFIDDYKPAIAAWLKDSPSIKGCEVPIGVALTRQVPVEIQVTPAAGIPAQVSRFVALSVIRAKPSGSGMEVGSVYVRPDDTPIKSGLAAAGAVALHRIGGTACPDQTTEFDWLFNVVMSSSSFPVAFAPRPVCYSHYGLPLFDKAQNARGEEGFAHFVDGGVFDNEPVAIAQALADLKLHEAGSALAPDPQQLAARQTVFITREAILQSLKVPPGRRPENDRLRIFATSGGHVLRGALHDRKDMRAEGDSIGKMVGSRAFTQMVGGAISSAMQYELQSLARARAREEHRKSQYCKTDPDKDSDLCTPLAEVIASTRGAEIVSEMIGGFAGFFGRPFREYDFYAGVYDGLHLLSHRGYLCVFAETARAARNCGDPRSLEKTRATLGEVIKANAFDLSPAALAVVTWRFAAEYDKKHPGLRVGDPKSDNTIVSTDCGYAKFSEAPKSNDKHKLATYCAVHQALQSLVPPNPARPEPACVAQSLAEKMMCSSGFGRFMKAFVAAYETVQPKRTDANFTDKDFLDLLAHPEITANEWLTRALDRFATMERRAEALGQKPLGSLVVKPLLMLNRGDDMPFRPLGVYISPSSGFSTWRSKSPGRAKLAAVVNVLAPHDYSEFNAGRLLGWRPVAIHPMKRFLLSGNLNWVWHQCDDAWTSVGACDGGRIDQLYGGGSLTFFKPNGGLFKVLPRTTEVRFEVPLGARDKFGTAISVSSRIWHGKLLFDLRRESRASTTPAELNKPTYEFRFGVSDLNGILYWLIR